MARICERVVKRPPMAPFSGNGRRRRASAEPGTNGSEVTQPVSLGGDDHVRIVSGGENPDGTH